jgi:hypothetical protein
MTAKATGRSYITAIEAYTIKRFAKRSVWSTPVLNHLWRVWVIPKSARSRKRQSTSVQLRWFVIVGRNVGWSK